MTSTERTWWLHHPLVESDSYGIHRGSLGFRRMGAGVADRRLELVLQHMSIPAPEARDHASVPTARQDVRCQLPLVADQPTR